MLTTSVLVQTQSPMSTSATAPARGGRLPFCACDQNPPQWRVRCLRCRQNARHLSMLPALPPAYTPPAPQKLYHKSIGTLEWFQEFTELFCKPQPPAAALPAHTEFHAARRTALHA